MISEMVCGNLSLQPYKYIFLLPENLKLQLDACGLRQWRLSTLLMQILQSISDSMWMSLSDPFWKTIVIKEYQQLFCYSSLSSVLQCPSSSGGQSFPNPSIWGQPVLLRLKDAILTFGKICIIFEGLQNTKRTLLNVPTQKDSQYQEITYMTEGIKTSMPHTRQVFHKCLPQISSCQMNGQHQFIVPALVLTCLGSQSHFLSEPHLKERRLKGSDLFTMRGGLWMLQRSTHSQSMFLSNRYRNYKAGKTRAVLTRARHPSLPSTLHSPSLCLFVSLTCNCTQRTPLLRIKQMAPCLA